MSKKTGSSPVESDQDDPNDPIALMRAKLGVERYRASSNKHAREYLTRVLTATGGDRVTAAAVAGLNRTHLQALIKRHGVTVPMNPKTRGRRKKTRHEARQTETAHPDVDW